MAKRRFGIASILTATLFVSSCSFYPLFPTVRLDEPPDNQRVMAVEVVPIATDSSGDKETMDARADAVQHAVDYAAQARTKYLQAQAQYEGMPGTFALMTLPAGGAALALGIQGEGGAPVTALGVAAASFIGLGSYLQNKDRETVYTTGAEGIQCLLSNMEPYSRITSNDLAFLDWSLHSTYYNNRYYGEYQDLNDAKTELEARINAVEALGLQKDCGKVVAVRRYASLLLKAAKASDKAANKAIQVGDNFLRTALGAPITLVNTTNKINVAVNAALIKSEPNIQSLAGNLKGAIPDQASNMASVNSLKAASTDAEETAQRASAISPLASAPGDTVAVSQISGAVDSVTADRAVSIPKSLADLLRHQSGRPSSKPAGQKPEYADLTNGEEYSLKTLQLSIYKVNTLTSGITRIVGSQTGDVDNDKCPTLAKKAGEVKSLTLNPGGDIIVSPGSKTTITIAGATDPYTRPLFSQNVCAAVTATLKGNAIDINAGKQTIEGFYPFFVGDGAIGRPLNVMVKKAAADATDDVQACKNGKPIRPKTSSTLCLPPLVPRLSPVDYTPE